MDNFQNKPIVWLVGAGCGNADLLTLQALKCIKACDALVYDDLLDKDILSLAENAEKIYAGKRAGSHYKSQEEIHFLLEQLCRKYKNIVRLKGGDPFVFGRGMEERLYLESRGIECRVLPGISSAIAIPERLNVPVTHRGMASSFTVITARTRKEDTLFEEDIHTLASLQGTLVILMGFSRLRSIAQSLMAAGKDPNTPAALLSSPDITETVGIKGTLAIIADLADASDLKAPAIIVIGETASFLKESLPADPGKTTVALTCTEGMSEKIRKFLPKTMDTVSPIMPDIVPLEWNPRLQILETTQWLVFVSATAARIFMQAMKKARLSLRDFPQIRIACIGKNTASVLEDGLIYADFIPSVATTHALAQELSVFLEVPSRLTVFRAQGADTCLETVLSKNHTVTRQDLYFLKYRIHEPCLNPEYLVFASPSSVHAWFQFFEKIPDTCLPVCISDVTASCMRQYTDAPCLVSSSIDAKGIAQVIAAHDSKKM